MAGSVDRLSVWAVRYALGRATYAVNDVVDVLTAERASLSPETRDCIVRDITEAEQRGNLGMDMDAQEWRRLRDALIDRQCNHYPGQTECDWCADGPTPDALPTVGEVRIELANMLPLDAMACHQRIRDLLARLPADAVLHRPGECEPPLTGLVDPTATEVRVGALVRVIEGGHNRLGVIVQMGDEEDHPGRVLVHMADGPGYPCWWASWVVVPVGLLR